MGSRARLGNLVALLEGEIAVIAAMNGVTHRHKPHDAEC